MGKYDKYFITDTPPNILHPQSRNKDSDFAWINGPISINEEVFGKVPGAFWLEPNIAVRPSKGTPGQGRPHCHLFDEYLLFMGLDPYNQAELGGEVEFWMGGEKHMITKTTAVFIPKGVWHTPLFFHRVDKPFAFIGIGNTLKYAHFQYDDDPKWDKSAGVLDEIVEVTLGGKKYQVTKTYSEYLRWELGKARASLP